MKQYDLGIVVNHPNCLWNDKFAIVIEDFYLEYYMIELWLFEQNNEVKVTSILPTHLRPTTLDESEEYLRKFKEYCDRNENSK